MDMTAATDFVEDYTNFWRYDIASGWHSQQPGVPGTLLEYLATIGSAARPHGAHFHYVSPNTDLLGIATARAAGAPLQDMLAREVWAPIGAEADAELTVDLAGTPVISGGLCATLRDYVRHRRARRGGSVRADRSLALRASCAAIPIESSESRRRRRPRSSTTPTAS
jgi:CubicO group peptidase (beta-lactamase class C family)